MDKRIERIRACEEKIRELSASEENRRREGFWADGDESDLLWPPKPKCEDVMPFTFDIERIGLAKILGFSLVRFYQDPVEYLLRSLESSIYLFEEFNDCTPIGPGVAYWPGVDFETCLFGMASIRTEEDNWIGRDPVVKERVPVGSLAMPGFHESEAMKGIFDFYERIREILSDDFDLEFPRWDRSSWGIAWQLRGIDNLIFDYIEDPEWLKDFLDFLTEARFRWSDARLGMLGPGCRKVCLFNDEVCAPMVSPALYEDIIIKNEIDVSEHFGGINYWHSCGNTSLFIPKIDTIPDVGMVHVSPWTDRAAAAEGYSKGKAIQVALHPVSEVISPGSGEAMRQALLDIKDIFKGHRATVRADGFEIMYSVERDVKQMKEWVRTANEVFLEA